MLAGWRHELPGNVVFLFQPAEETIAGAKQMITEGVLVTPRIDAAFGVHLWNNLPVGTIGIRSGPVFAGADELRLRVIGKGGHGALPHQTVDAIAVAGQIVSALQTIVSRNVPPLIPAVMTIGTIHGGKAFNIIADQVEMTGTIRTFDRATRELILGRMEGLVRGVAAGFGADCELEVKLGCPPVVNHHGMSELAARVATDVVGEKEVVSPEQTMGGDDFAYFLEQFPGCYALVGSANAELGLDQPHHHAGFNFDERALAISARYLAGVAVEYLTSTT